MAWPTAKDVERRFRERPMTEAEEFAFLALRQCAGDLTELIRRNTPGSADQWAAIRKVREAMDATRNAIVCSDLPSERLSETARVSVRLAWAGDVSYEWICPGCSHQNLGHVPPRTATPEEVTCVHCSATLKTI